MLAMFHLSGNQSFSNKCTIKFGRLQDTTSEEISYRLNLDKFFIAIFFFILLYLSCSMKFSLTPVENETWILQIIIWM